MLSPSPIRILLLVSNPLDAEVNIADDVAALAELPASAEVVVCVAEAIKDLLAPANRPPFRCR
jgi:hypothetical protein